MIASPPSPRRLAATAAALALLVVVVYAPARRFEFLHLDDNEYVTENAAVRSGLNAGSVRWAWTAYHSGHWHPLTWLSLMADVERSGVDPGAMHTTNVLLHAACAALLFLALHAATGHFGASAFAAALFALHPLRVESVAWVATRKDVLSGLFVMLLLWAWAGYARRESLTRYLLALAAFGLALLAKPTVAVVPCGLLLLDWWPLRRLPFSPPADLAATEAGTTSDAPATRSALWILAEKIPFFAIAALTLTQTWAAQNAAGAVTASDALTLPVRVANALWNYALYLARTAWPFDLGVFYPLAKVPPEKAVAVAVLLVLVTFAALRERQRRPWLLLGWLWFCGMLVPVSGIVQFGGQAMADRYTWLPHIGLFVAVAWEAADRVRRSTMPRFAAPAAAVGVLGAFAALTSLQLAWWSDSVRLLTRTIAVTSDNYLAHNNLGVALESLGRFEEAAPHYLEAARINPTWPEALSNSGIVLARQGRMKEALERFESAVRIRPGFAKAHNNLATALSSLGEADRAMQHFQIAVDLDAGYVDARVALAQVLERKGRTDEAGKHYAIAASQAPGVPVIQEALARVRGQAGTP
jgi:tetratricopeptide (TPR) repeat protein